MEQDGQAGYPLGEEPHEFTIDQQLMFWAAEWMNWVIERPVLMRAAAEEAAAAERVVASIAPFLRQLEDVVRGCHRFPVGRPAIAGALGTELMRIDQDAGAAVAAGIGDRPPTVNDFLGVCLRVGACPRRV